NRQLVEATLENMTQGVSVVDAEQRLVGWNRRYLELMDYDENLVHVGQPVAALIEHNAARGRFGDSDPAQAVAKRLKLLRSGSAYTYESQFDGGKVIQIRGQPMPGGGYVTTYTDITAFKQVEAELVAAKEQLEERVAERTAALEDAMAMLSSAKQEAEQANRSKTSFLAAAAHDLLQPLNATKLFTAVLHEHSTSMPQEQRELVDRIKSGLVSVEDLLTALLDISKLDTAAPQPHVEATPVARLFDALNTQFSPSFTESGLSLRFADTGYWVASDAALLRRILQNFVSNARRYTKSGGVLVGCRLRNDHIAIQVIDTGVGIASHDQQAVFEEFKRLPGSAQTAKRGLGLGLAIVKRIARLLGHDIRMQSVPGKGSTFEVLVPRADAATYPAPAAAARSMPNPVISEHIICVDNEPDILEAMRSLLTKWGALPATAATPNAAAAVAMAIRDEQKRLPAIMLVDYHLDDGATGLDAIAKVREVLQRDIPAIVLTADHSDDLAERVASLGHRLLFKPVKPAALRALIMSVLGSTQR
ncbi:MAG: NahK/ErcS family hybrid sensor histidine kinase/response regulator, partial [Pseudomonadota bacterium]